IRVDYASHTAQVDPLLPSILAALKGLRPQPGRIPFYSTVTGRRMDGALLNASYWCRNEREPFDFPDARDRLIEDGLSVFLDVNPHPVLIRPITQCLSQGGRTGLVLPLMQKGEGGFKALLDSLGALWVRGQEIRWNLLFRVRVQSAGLPIL